MLNLTIRSAAAAALGLAAGFCGPAGFGNVAALAQDSFAPVVRVNDRAVTEYEINQRTLFLNALQSLGENRETAIERLIDERLQMDAADRMGIEVGEGQIEAGMEEFASRSGLSAEEFTSRIEAEGVDAESFRQFVRVGIAWREVVQGRFGPRAQVTEAEIDRALALSTSLGGVRVLVSEIFLPATTPEARTLSTELARQISQIETIPAFAEAARTHSEASSGAQGGELDWLPLANLPLAVSSQLLTLAPGQVTEPIPVPDAIALFQLRDIQETGIPEPDVVSIDFARYFIPGGRSERALAEAARIEERVDICGDLYGIAADQPPERLEREDLPVEEIPLDVAVELAKLDEGEISTALTSGNGAELTLLMLCGRSLAPNEDISRSEVRASLRNQRLASYAVGYLSELRADANIQRVR